MDTFLDELQYERLTPVYKSLSRRTRITSCCPVSFYFFGVSSILQCPCLFLLTESCGGWGGGDIGLFSMVWAERLKGAMVQLQLTRFSFDVEQKGMKQKKGMQLQTGSTSGQYPFSSDLRGCERMGHRFGFLLQSKFLGC
jgi:hypothetical protein